MVPDADSRDRVLFDVMIELESELDVHVASFSAESAVYKVMGAPLVLQKYFNDLNDPRAETVSLLGHNRYSTNTWPSFMRVQPFSVLGHNGEINTIARLRAEARMLAVPIAPGSSDSQDLNRTVDTLVNRAGLSLPEAMELAVPPIVNEIRQFPEELRGFYMYLRQAMGPFAQGPIALVARHGDEHVFSVDALGLRPLWQVESFDSHVFSSEPGVVPLSEIASDPKPLSPGEKVFVRVKRDRESRLYDHQQMQKLVHERWLERTGAEAVAGFEQALPTGGPLEGPEIPGYDAAGPAEPVKVEDRILAGFGWQREDSKLVQQMGSNGQEPIGSLGYDGPLAALSPERQNLADYFKETVAVVTNPAIDREREIEHFSCRAVFGARPSIDDPAPRRARSRRPSRSSSAATTAWRRSPTRSTARSPRSTRRSCSRTSGRSSRDAARCSTFHCSTPRRPRARSSGCASRPRSGCSTAPSCWCSPTAPSTRASGRSSTRTWPYRRSTVRCATTASAPVRRTCADAPRSCCARPPCATSTTSAWRSGSAPTASAPT